MKIINVLFFIFCCISCNSLAQKQENENSQLLSSKGFSVSMVEEKRTNDLGLYGSIPFQNKLKLLKAGLFQKKSDGPFKTPSDILTHYVSATNQDWYSELFLSDRLLPERYNGSYYEGRAFKLHFYINLNLKDKNYVILKTNYFNDTGKDEGTKMFLLKKIKPTERLFLMNSIEEQDFSRLSIDNDLTELINFFSKLSNTGMKIIFGKNDFEKEFSQNEILEIEKIKNEIYPIQKTSNKLVKFNYPRLIDYIKSVNQGKKVKETKILFQ